MDGHTATLQTPHFIHFFNKIYTEFFKHAAYFKFFSLQNAIDFIMLPFFVFCIIRILHTGCAKILMPNSGAKRLS
jgi:hypothetical protein